MYLAELSVSSLLVKYETGVYFFASSAHSRCPRHARGVALWVVDSTYDVVVCVCVSAVDSLFIFAAMSL